jgi:hypothetical protein
MIFETEEELARAVIAAVDALNYALRRASDADLHCTVTTSERRELGRLPHLVIVHADVFKRLP